MTPPSHTFEAPKNKSRSGVLWRVELIVSLVVLALAVFISHFTDLDMTVARAFYVQRQSVATGILDKLWYWFYLAAGTLTVSFGIVLLAGLATSLAVIRFRDWRFHFLYGIFVILFGPGLVVNGILKEAVGRPRPRNIIEFGGTLDYHSILQPIPGSRNLSFPCGHASIIFALYAIYFIIPRRLRLLRGLVFVAVTIAGAISGIGRIAVGAHFLTDVIATGALVFLAAHILYYGILNIPNREDNHDGTAQAGVRLLFPLGLLSAVIIAIGGIFAIPLNRTFSHVVPVDGRTLAVDIRLRRSNAEITFTNATELMIRGHLEGFRGFNDNAGHRFRTTDKHEVTVVLFEAKPRGWFSDVDSIVSAAIPSNHVSTIKIELEDSQIRLEGSAPPTGLQIEAIGSRVMAPDSWSHLAASNQWMSIRKDQKTLYFMGDPRQSGHDSEPSIESD